MADAKLAPLVTREFSICLLAPGFSQQAMRFVLEDKKCVNKDKLGIDRSDGAPHSPAVRHVGRFVACAYLLSHDRYQHFLVSWTEARVDRAPVSFLSQVRWLRAGADFAFQERSQPA